MPYPILYKVLRETQDHKLYSSYVSRVGWETYYPLDRPVSAKTGRLFVYGDWHRAEDYHLFRDAKLGWIFTVRCLTKPVLMRCKSLVLDMTYFWKAVARGRNPAYLFGSGPISANEQIYTVSRLQLLQPLFIFEPNDFNDRSVPSPVDLERIGWIERS